jgi:hypothetical protein
MPTQEQPSRTELTRLPNRSIELFGHIGLLELATVTAFAVAIFFIMTWFVDAIPPELLQWLPHAL